MKSKKSIIIILAALVVLTAALAMVHFATRDVVPDGSILVSQNGDTRYVNLSDFSLTQVNGTTVNGKGEERTIDAQGIPLGELADGSFRTVTVTSDDEYSAQVDAEEMENAYLIADNDTARLIVFGDKNSKRDVKNVVKVAFV